MGFRSLSFAVAHFSMAFISRGAKVQNIIPLPLQIQLEYKNKSQCLKGSWECLEILFDLLFKLVLFFFHEKKHQINT
jgi:hypothetical protein